MAEQHTQKIERFLEEYYNSTIMDRIRNNKDHVVLDTKDLLEFDHELVEQLIENPQDTIHTFKKVIEEFSHKKTHITPRFKNLPKTCELPISQLRKNHLEKLHSLKGVVRRKSEITKTITNTTFECQACGTHIHILQKEKTLKTPTRCSCGSKKGFLTINTELVDGYTIVLEEDPETSETTELSRIHCFLKEDLCNPEVERRLIPGTKIRINGVYKATPKKQGKYTSTELETYIETNYVHIQDDQSISIQN